jgi:hypothetical protein
VSLCFLDFVFDEHSLVKMLCLCGARQREVRERCVRREERVFLFMNIIIIRIAIVEPYI